jgi:hypothetical protein
MNWTVKVTNHAGSVVYSKTGTGSGLDIPWWAKTSSGALVPQDDYVFHITASNSSGSVRPTDVPVAVWRYPNGTFFIAQPSGQTWILDHGKLRHPTNYQARGTRYLVAEAITIPDDVKNHYPVGSNIGFRDGSLVSADGKTYVISAQYRRPISNAAMASLGYHSSAIISTTTDALSANPLGSTVQASSGHPDGTALTSNMAGEAYMVKGVARPLISRNVRMSYLIRDIDLAGPADDEVIAGAGSSPLGFRPGSLVQVSGQTTIYVIADGKRHAISTYTFNKMGYDADNVRTVTPAELALDPEGAPL